MFHRDGRWKEFGLEEGTIFPFWLFCVMWAIVSYFAAYFTVSDTVVIAAAAINASRPSNLQDIFAANDNEIQPLPVTVNKTNNNAAKEEGSMKPGYYRLNTNATKKSGVPRYIYVGPENPEAGSEED